jgi:hypothetical protein
MPYITLNLADKIEMNGFDTETEARAYCRKASYPIFLLFEGTFEDWAEDKLTRPIAIYVKGQGFNTVPVEKDVPYITYRVILSRLPNAPGFAFVLAGDKTYGEVKAEVEAAFAQNKELVWVIYEDSRLIEIRRASERQTYRWLRETDTLDGGAVIPGFSLPVTDLFEEVVVE